MTLFIPTFPASPNDHMMWGSVAGKFDPDTRTMREERDNLSDERKAFADKYKEIS